MKLVLGVYDTPPHPFHYRWIDETWTLSDLTPRNGSIKQVDARNIPYRDLEAIYASHVVEHIAGEDLLPMFKHWHDVLELEGKVIINVPDMDWVEEHFTEMDYKRLGEVIFGGRETPADRHQSWFTKGYLEYLLKEAGFSDIVIYKEFEAHDMGCLIAEAIK